MRKTAIILARPLSILQVAGSGDRETKRWKIATFMPTSWSAQIADRYCCELSAQLADWFDSERWKYTGGGEFRESVSPEQLLEDAPEVIWPGLMACDVLPIVGNTAGDWLCVRINENSSASEIVHWYHGGGDWIPWGRHLAEAIAFDHLVSRLPGPSLRHAIPAENPRPRQSDGGPYLDWAGDHLPAQVADLFRSPGRCSDSFEIAELLLQHHVAEPAVRCEMISHFLLGFSETIEKSIQSTSDDLDEIAKWCFDLDRLPAKYHQQVQHDAGREIDEIQCWNSAEQHARVITTLHPDLAWGWDILGYAAELRGEQNAAKSSYLSGAKCSMFSDQSVRLKTHWMSDRALKFSAARLAVICPEVVQENSYLSLLSNLKGDPNSAVTQHWLGQGYQFHDEGKFLDAVRCFTAAGWDVGAGPMPVYSEILDRVADSAKQCGQFGREALCRVHRKCLQDRYGL